MRRADSKKTVIKPRFQTVPDEDTFRNIVTPNIMITEENVKTKSTKNNVKVQSRDHSGEDPKIEFDDHEEQKSSKGEKSQPSSSNIIRKR